MKGKTISIIEKLILICFLLLLILAQNQHELWLDELDWSIGIVNIGNWKEVNTTVLKTGENLPLFYIILYGVKTIFGYQQWVMTFLTATIFTILGVLGILKISDQLLGREKRVYTILFMSISYSIISQCGWQLRPYGLLFCCSAWTLYFYLQKIKSFCFRNLAKYTILMILLMYSHWFGVLICLTYAFIEFFLFLQKKIRWEFIVPYIIAGLAFLPSFIILLKLHKTDIGTYGVEIPSFRQIISVFQFLGGNYLINGCLIVMTLVVSLCNQFKNDTPKEAIQKISWMVFLLVGLTYLYSKYINPQGSIIRNRYFVVLLPHAIILLTFGFLKLLEFSKSNAIYHAMIKVAISFILLIEIFMFMIFIFFFPNHEGKSFYKGWANYLEKQQDAYDENTLIICTYGKTWIDYYFSFQNKKLPMNIIGVDPLEIPNMQDMAEEEISDFRYFVKNGEKANERITAEDIKKYDRIYYLEEYRTISKEFQTVLEAYDQQKIEEANLYKLEKKDEK